MRYIFVFQVISRHLTLMTMKSIIYFVSVYDSHDVEDSEDKTGHLCDEESLNSRVLQDHSCVSSSFP